MTTAPADQGETADRSVEAVVFDLGNVLIEWDPEPAIAQAVGAEEARRFLADASFDFLAWNHLQDAGRAWTAAESAGVASHPHWQAHILGYRQNFTHSLVGSMAETVGLLEELHAAKVPLYALTNWSAETFPHARERYAFLDLFDDIVVSGEEGLAKPDPQIFAVLQRRLGRPLSACVFVDDQSRNVDAARAAGLDAVLFVGARRLREELRDRGLPLRPAGGDAATP